ncbi:MAG: hypothetical protein IPK31_08980 [Chitinophagaceae bacterium]|nr:hypothetical protein [Chitinophagaceae bacterium]
MVKIETTDTGRVTFSRKEIGEEIRKRMKADPTGFRLKDARLLVKQMEQQLPPAGTATYNTEDDQSYITELESGEFGQSYFLNLAPNMVVYPLNSQYELNNFLKTTDPGYIVDYPEDFIYGCNEWYYIPFGVTAIYYTPSVPGQRSLGLFITIPLKYVVLKNNSGNYAATEYRFTYDATTHPATIDLTGIRLGVVQEKNFHFEYDKDSHWGNYTGHVKEERTLIRSFNGDFKAEPTINYQQYTLGMSLGNGFTVQTSSLTPTNIDINGSVVIPTMGVNNTPVYSFNHDIHIIGYDKNY